MAGMIIASSLLGISVVLNLWQWLAGKKFPLHRRRPDKKNFPPLTLLKPLKGADLWTERCLESWCTQQYPGPIQILFGISSEKDQAAAVVHSLQKRHPNLELVVCPPGQAANAKAGKLEQLVRRARHEIVVISDADILAPDDLLSELMHDLAGQETGLVHCFYRMPQAETAAMKWEAASVNADFWTQVLQSASLKPVDFALGAVMALRRSDLEATGGFERLRDFLADDFQLGQAVARLGKQIRLSPVVVESIEGPKTWREIWQHQLRWARTVRACQPVGYFFSILSNGTLWLLLWLGFSWSLYPWNFLAAVLFILARELSGRSSALKLLGKPLPFWPLLCLVDLFNLVRWLGSFCNNTVEWRGEKLRLVSGGKVVR